MFNVVYYWHWDYNILYDGFRSPHEWNPARGKKYANARMSFPHHDKKMMMSAHSPTRYLSTRCV